MASNTGLWQPIESAPRDGTPILACCAPPPAWKADWRYAPIVVAWRTYHPNALGKPLWRQYDGRRVAGLTHWTPLPPLPAPETGGLGGVSITTH